MNSIEINAVFCRLKTSTKISLIPQSFSSSPAAYSHFLNSTAQICGYRHSLPSSLCSTSRNMSYHSDSRRRDSYAQQYERYRVSGSRVDRTYRSSSPSTQVSGIRRQSSVHSSLPRIRELASSERRHSDSRTTSSITKRWGQMSLSTTECKPGAIIRSMVFEPWRTDMLSSTTSNKSLIQTAKGPICAKERKLIVIQTYRSHYIALPCFSHNGNGLQYKSNKDEYVSIMDYRTPDYCEIQSSHDPLVTEHLKDEVFRYHPATVAQLTYPVSRSYDLPSTVEGYLTKESTGRLRELYYRYTPKPSDKEGRSSSIATLKAIEAQTPKILLNPTEERPQAAYHFSTVEWVNGKVSQI
jgi:hypothetical protein